MNHFRWVGAGGFPAGGGRKEFQRGRWCSSGVASGRGGKFQPRAGGSGMGDSGGEEISSGRVVSGRGSSGRCGTNVRGEGRFFFS